MVLRVSRLSVDIESADGRFPVVDQVGFELHRGKTLALVGESGSGKSLTALAIMRLLPAGARVAAGETWLGTTNLLGRPASAMRDIRGVRIGMIFQEPMTCLNPVMSIGQQVAEPLRVHHRMSRRQAWRRATEMLERVGLTPGGRCARRYPHELSGGMRQRAMIAMALICG
ncbi:MAG: ABC transporter ATP-binding protein, partial [Planctomycetota bacterium]